MYIVVYRAWNGKRCEICYNEKEAREKHWELSGIYKNVRLLKVEKEIMP